MEGPGVFVPPRNEVEQQVAAVWQAVLKLARVSVHENFFELGGHSLLAGQVTSRLRHAFEVDLPMRSLFEQPTIEGLTAYIERLLIDEIQQLSEEEAEELVG
jgi:acyl carrier protein